jgi:hypothetical protein
MEKSSQRASFEAANAFRMANTTRHSVTTIKTGHLLDIYSSNHKLEGFFVFSEPLFNEKILINPKLNFVGHKNRYVSR